MDSYEIRTYCIENHLFSCGSGYQYDKMFRLHQENPDDLHSLALIIWLCSETEKTVEEIELDLKEIKENY